MATIHIKDGVEYQVGQVLSLDGKSFDITVYFYFPQDGNVKMVGWHFGEYDEATANEYIVCSK